MNPYSDTNEKPEEKKKPNLASVRVDENGNKFYTVDTSKWSEKVRKIYEEHFGKLPEEDSTNNFAADEKPLIINDLVTDTPATTGNKSAIPENPNPVQTAQTKAPLYPPHLNPYRTPTATTGNKSAIPVTTANTHEPANHTATTGNKPAIPATHEPATLTATTGKKPAKPEMKNKLNMIHETNKRQTIEEEKVQPL